MTQSIRVFGVPGAGKTTRLISMLKDLNKKYRMREIIYCSYTTAAVNEVKDRIADRYEDRDLIWFKTLHGICFRLLNQGGKPASKRDRINHLSKFSDHFDMEDLIDSLPFEEATEDQIVKWIHNTLDQLVLKYPEKGDEVLKVKLARMVGPGLVEIIIKYKLSWFVYCKQNDLFEFNRLLLDVYRQKLVPDARVLIVDEFQDINHLQNLIIKQFSDKMEMMINAGDHNQSIYGFRGADPRFLKEVKRDSEINLMDTHRLPSKIVAYTKKILPHDDMVQKMSAISDEEGEVEFISFDSVDFDNLDNYESVFILARTNAMITEVRSRLMERGIVTSNKKSSKSKIGRLVKLIDRIENDKSIHHRDLKLFSDEKLRLDKLFVDWNMQKLFYDWMDDVENNLDGVSNSIDTDLLGKLIGDNIKSRIAKLLKNRDDRIIIENFGRPISNIELMTIHGSKGKEADLVVLINKASGFEFRDDIDEEEEKRVYYVGVTRARKKLVIAHLDDDRDSWTRFLPVNAS